VQGNRQVLEIKGEPERQPRPQGQHRHPPHQGQFLQHPKHPEERVPCSSVHNSAVPQRPQYEQHQQVYSSSPAPQSHQILFAPVQSGLLNHHAEAVAHHLVQPNAVTGRAQAPQHVSEASAPNHHQPVGMVPHASAMHLPHMQYYGPHHGSHSGGMSLGYAQPFYAQHAYSLNPYSGQSIPTPVNYLAPHYMGNVPFIPARDCWPMTQAPDSSVPGCGVVCAEQPYAQRVIGPPETHTQLIQADRFTGNGSRPPTNRHEREDIARRMAAMDFENEMYGGKHREQWQAIAIHLLKEYEFTDETDRQTSKHYVRLCALKDELRSNNRVRITVNHTKEFFRILNLQVTGEWDRRGHGGVRGPYVYGIRCVTDRSSELGSHL
jgi:hypothetical protein